MRILRSIRFYAIVLASAATCLPLHIHAQAKAAVPRQPIPNAPPPTNIDCSTAFHLCTSRTFDYYHTDAGGALEAQRPSCLWFSFCITGEENDPSVQVQGVSGAWSGLVDRYYLAGFSECGQADSTYDCPIEHPTIPTGSTAASSGGVIDLSGLAPGTYYLVVLVKQVRYGRISVQFNDWNTCCLPVPDCPDCLSSFSPLADSTYIVTAWVSMEDLEAGTTEITGPYLKVEAPEGVELQSAPEIGPLIDGWQRMEWRFVMSDADPDLLIVSLGSTEGVALFDDVRIFPELGAQTSYVYDPLNLRFVAQLDERHFATFYEYDPEGRLVRMKKETERGIMTIQETRENTSKR